MAVFDFLLLVVAPALLAGVCVFLLLWALGVGVEAICKWVSTRWNQQRAREEAELDRTARELQETIQGLAEAIAEERLSAERTSRDMKCLAADSARD